MGHRFSRVIVHFIVPKKLAGRAFAVSEIGRDQFNIIGNRRDLVLQSLVVDEFSGGTASSLDVG